jgi:hypothetical protein
MKLPRVSIGSIMTCLVIVAIDCATLRTLELENIVEMRIGHFSEVVLAILAMSNVIAVLMARMIRDGFWFRPSRF